MPSIEKMGESLVASLAGLHVHPYARQFANQAIEFHKLLRLSDRTPDEVKRHAAHWPGTLWSLQAFYSRHNCFPCEIAGESSGQV